LKKSVADLEEQKVGHRDGHITVFVTNKRKRAIKKMPLKRASFKSWGRKKECDSGI